MSVAWTKNQEKVINASNKNILVSAAAGSGKTAVLVERIIKMVTDEKNPVDIERLLVVTFTNAAASEMRDRIREALEKKLEEDPENAHCQRQLTLIHHGNIMTIHSFCLNLIRNYFYKISLDPSFRIGEEGELQLIREDSVTDLLEREYEEGREEFLEFVETYSTGKNDLDLKEYIFTLFHFAMSSPNPKAWLDECQLRNKIQSVEEMESAEWMKELLDSVKDTLEFAKKLGEKAVTLSSIEPGPLQYKPTLETDLVQIEYALEQNSFQNIYRAMGQIEFGRLSSKKPKEWEVAPETKEEVSTLRKEYKSLVTKLREEYFFQSLEGMAEDMRDSFETTRELVELVHKFMDIYHEKKREKNLLDFNDLEHFALQILINEEGIPTPVADELSAYFYEVMVDEYQDSNMVQEHILTSVSKERFGKNNRFMVGDVKQSIYRFRQARPELFLEKYNTYPMGEDKNTQRIDLDQNFRSRKEVLNSVNQIFHGIMGEAVGEINYDERAALYVGASYLEPKEAKSNQTEIFLIESPAESQEEESEFVQEEEFSEEDNKTLNNETKNLEARAIGMRIKELLDEKNGFQIVDKKTGEYRNLQYKDIVILLRTVSNWAEVFAETLNGMGIPTYATSSQGYFSSIEISRFIGLLRVIDNPLQDIPFAGSLVSGFGGFSSEELAQLRSVNQEKSIPEIFFSLVNDWLSIEENLTEENPLEEGFSQEANQFEPQWKEKAIDFYYLIQDFREKATYMTVHELLWNILDNTGYKEYVMALPGGEQRKLNLDMLLERAKEFEKTSFHGLFHFIRYIEKMKQYQVDFGSMGIVSENSDVVRIMSMHKSKGLEFPVVFVSGLSKKFNQRERSGRIVLHPNYGIGVDFYNPYTRVKSPTLLKKVISNKIKTDNLGEELRILYVAMTRAKEKLILTGYPGNLESKRKRWENLVIPYDYQIPGNLILSSTSSLDWILPCFYRNSYKMESWEEADFINRKILLTELVEDQVMEEIEKKAFHELVEEAELITKEKQEEISEQFQFEYPYAAEMNEPMKVSVSEMKARQKAALEESEQELVKIEFQNEEMQKTLGEKYSKVQEFPIPEFMKKEKEVTATARGTAFHKVLELLRFENYYEKDTTESESILRKEIEEWILLGKFSKEAGEMVPIREICKFLHSNLGKRMTTASKCGKIYREQPFVMGLLNQPDSVLIQGIIDVFFEEEGEIVLVDYKTDSVNTPGELVERYQVQLDYYQAAIERAWNKKVKEKIIYSFKLQEEVYL